MRILVLALLPGFALGWAAWPAQQGKHEEEPRTQVLTVPKEPPQAVVADTNRMVFFVSPLSGKGLLSQQVRDGLKGLLGQAGGAAVVKVRAFVAGSGDMRRVSAIVSEVFTQRRLPLPVVTAVQVGALPVTGAQVVMEATAVARRPANPNGLAFVSAQAAEQDGLPPGVVALANKSVPMLESALLEAGLAGSDVVRATCFLSSLEDVSEVRGIVAAAFPKAALNFVQPERAPSKAVAACEVVARLRTPVGAPLRLLKREHSAGSAAHSDVALVGAPRVVLTGGQMSFNYADEDARLAFQRLGKTLEQANSAWDRVAWMGFYVLSRPIGEQVQRVAAGFLDPAKPPAGTLLPCVGLPSLDAGFTIDAVAVPGNSQ
jgi:enamine deaminase RidA (YjgF/YER057c/UK114 family)